MLSLLTTYPALLPLTKLTSSLVGFFYNCFLNDLPASTRPPPPRPSPCHQSVLSTAARDTLVKCAILYHFPSHSEEKPSLFKLQDLMGSSCDPCDLVSSSSGSFHSVHFLCKRVGRLQLQGFCIIFPLPRTHFPQKHSCLVSSFPSGL